MVDASLWASRRRLILGLGANVDANADADNDIWMWGKGQTDRGLSAQTRLTGARKNKRGMALRALGVLAEPLGPLLGNLQLERVV